MSVPHFSQSKHGSTLVRFQVSSIVAPIGSSTTKTIFRKVHNSAPSNSKSPGSQIECHHCYAKGHISSLYPQSTLLLGLVENAQANSESHIYVHEPMNLHDDADLGFDDNFDDLDDST